MSSEGDKRRPSVTSLLAFALLLTVLYVLSYPPYVRFSGSEDTEVQSTSVSLAVLPDEYPIYKPVDWLIDNTSLRKPLFLWAGVWGVRHELENAARLRSINVWIEEFGRHVVMIHAESSPPGVNRFCPAFVVESNETRSLLVSASWGAEPFPIPPAGQPVDFIHVMDSHQPVEIVAYDEELGVGVFSIQESLQPWPMESIAEEVAIGDELEELILVNRHYDPPPYESHEVVATEQRFPYRTADGINVIVEDTIIFEGQPAANPGSLLLKDGKLAAIYLNNAGPVPLKRHAIPVGLLLNRYRELLGAADQ